MQTFDKQQQRENYNTYRNKNVWKLGGTVVPMHFL